MQLLINQPMSSITAQCAYSFVTVVFASNQTAYIYLKNN